MHQQTSSKQKLPGEVLFEEAIGTKITETGIAEFYGRQLEKNDGVVFWLEAKIQCS